MKRISSPIQGVHDCLRCLVLLPTLLALPSCEVAANLEMETNLPARPNPTAWVFDRPLNEVVEAIRAAHGDYALARGEPEQIGEIPFASVADILNVRGNEHDFYLWHPRHPYGWSEAYRSSSGPLPYRADFHLHLFSPSPTRTSVEVRVIRPQVHAWAWRGPLPHWGQDVWIDVEPTTVEEYRVLLAIGRVLKENDMPEIVLPKLRGA